MNEDNNQKAVNEIVRLSRLAKDPKLLKSIDDENSIGVLFQILFLSCQLQEVMNKAEFRL